MDLPNYMTYYRLPSLYVAVLNGEVILQKLFSRKPEVLIPGG